MISTATGRLCLPILCITSKILPGTDKKNSGDKSDGPKPTPVPRYPNMDLPSKIICKAEIFGLLWIISRPLYQHDNIPYLFALFFIESICLSDVLQNTYLVTLAMSAFVDTWAPW